MRAAAQPTPTHTMISNLAKYSLVATAIATSPAILSAQSILSLVAEKDATLYESASGTVANGGGSKMFVGRVGANGNFEIRRTVIKWNIAGSIPAGSRIIAVNLDMNVDLSSAFLPQAATAHRVLQNWSEGNATPGGNGGAGTGATNGSVTWLHTNYPSQFWTNTGGDFASSPSFTFDLPGFGPLLTPPLPGLVADVQDMLDNPSNNHGWLFKTPEVLTSNARAIASSEASFNKPELQITYLTPGQTGTYGIGCPVGGGTFQLSLSGTASGGNTIPIIYSNAPSPSIGVNFFALAIDPIGAPLFPSCTVYLPLAGTIISGDAFITAGGVGGSNFTVPTGFPGYLINVQAAVLDATPLNISLSNSGIMLLQ
jgi:hypothetical protein